MTITSIAVKVQTRQGDVTVFLAPDEHMGLCKEAAKLAAAWVLEVEAEPEPTRKDFQAASGRV